MLLFLGFPCCECCMQVVAARSRSSPCYLSPKKDGATVDCGLSSKGAIGMLKIVPPIYLGRRCLVSGQLPWPWWWCSINLMAHHHHHLLFSLWWLWSLAFFYFSRFFSGLHVAVGALFTSWGFSMLRIVWNGCCCRSFLSHRLYVVGGWSSLEEDGMAGFASFGSSSLSGQVFGLGL